MPEVAEEAHHFSVTVDQKGCQCEIHLELKAYNGLLRASSLTIEQMHDGPPITEQILRNIPLDMIVRDARQFASKHLGSCCP